MTKPLILAALTSVLATATIASDLGYDPNEAFSPADVEMIKAAFEADFGSATPTLVRVAGDVDA